MWSLGPFPPLVRRLFLLLLTHSGAYAVPRSQPIVEERLFGSPTVTISVPKATIEGSSRPFINILDPGPFGTLESFKGMPFAQPPVGPLRLKPPVPLDPNTDLGQLDATTMFPDACPQQYTDTQLNIPNIPGLEKDVLETILNSPLVKNDVVGGNEDCLTLNVQRPGGVKAGDNLPVLLWIFGGGFEIGSSATYDGAHVVETSVALGKPVVFVAINYRVAGFGFLGGKEVLADGSANLGLLDQRLAMQWVSDNIREFGGDPDKVTLWGESAGAISIFDQLVAKNGDNTYNGKPLFHGVIMNSGSAVPADPVDCPKAQAIYDQVVVNAGCAGTTDTLNCLRGLPYDTFLNATNSVPSLLSYSSLALSYLPRPDGTFLASSPEQIANTGQYARVPFILGDQQDEGTLFAVLTSNISTTADLTAYLRQLYFANPAADVDTFVSLYPDDPAAGSPFDTGADNNFYPQYKRVAALLGDATFTLTRRAVLNFTTGLAPDVPSWSYLAVYDHGTPVLGTLHGSDIIQVFYGEQDNYASRAVLSYFLNFAYNLDPNNATGGAEPKPGIGGDDPPQLIDWPRWSEGNTLVQFDADSFNYTQDDFRQEAFEFILQNVGTLHF